MKKLYTTPCLSKETFGIDVIMASDFELISSPDYRGDVF